jgi:hypothetical protein
MNYVARVIRGVQSEKAELRGGVQTGLHNILRLPLVVLSQHARMIFLRGSQIEQQRQTNVASPYDE